MKPLQHKGFSVSSTLGKDVLEFQVHRIEGAAKRPTGKRRPRPKHEHRNRLQLTLTRLLSK